MIVCEISFQGIYRFGLNCKRPIDTVATPTNIRASAALVLKHKSKLN